MNCGLEMPASPSNKPFEGVWGFEEAEYDLAQNQTDERRKPVLDKHLEGGEKSP